MKPLLLAMWKPQWRTVLFLAVLLTVVSCSTPGPAETYPKAITAADEAYAIQTLRTIGSAQTQSKVIRGSYADFAGLTQAGLLDGRFNSPTPTLRGYKFTIKATDSDFSVNADPLSQLSTAASRHLYLDSSDQSIRVNKDQPATHNDPPL